MSVLLVLIAIAVLRLTASVPNKWIAAAALLACLYAGLTLPDIDQPLPLDHRSALTHSIAPALAVGVPRWARAAAAGLALGLAFHLSADIFPNAMTGYATVAVPFGGRLDAGGSYAWLIANLAACTVAGAWLLVRTVTHPGAQAVALLGAALVGLSYLPRVDGGWPALALLLVAGWLAVRRLRIRTARQIASP